MLLTGCTSNDNDDDDNNAGDQTKVAGGKNAEPGKTVTIGFSAPAADHGWIAAITNNAKAQAGKYSRRDVQPGRGRQGRARAAGRRWRR